MKLKLGDRVRASGRIMRTRKPSGRREWYQPDWSRPLEGMFVGVRTYVNGTVDGGYNYDDPIVFKGDKWIRVALIVQDPRHKPIPVLYNECEVIS